MTAPRLIEEHVYWCESPDRDCICPGGPQMVPEPREQTQAERDALTEMVECGNQLWAALTKKDGTA